MSLKYRSADPQVLGAEKFSSANTPIHFYDPFQFFSNANTDFSLLLPQHFSEPLPFIHIGRLNIIHMGNRDRWRVACNRLLLVLVITSVIEIKPSAIEPGICLLVLYGKV